MTKGDDHHPGRGERPSALMLLVGGLLNSVKGEDGRWVDGRQGQRAAQRDIVRQARVRPDSAVPNAVAVD